MLRTDGQCKTVYPPQTKFAGGIKIPRRNKILTSNRGHNSATNLQKMTCNDPKLDTVNMNAYIKFCEILSICSQDIEPKQNSDINQGP